MKSNKLRNTVVSTFVILLFAGVSAQSKYDGDLLPAFLGKTAESPELLSLKTSYQLEMANESHYLSSQGIELIFESGVLHEIQLYRQSTVYGQFTGDLPRGLKFGMTANEVKKILGRPTVVYSSTGYLEFEWNNNYVYSCSFENGLLNQVSIGLK